MYVRIVRANVDLAQEREVQRVVQDALVPALQSLPGIQSCIAGFERTAGRLVVITTWDTEEHARFTREQIADAGSQVRALGAEFEETPEVFAARTYDGATGPGT